MNGKLVLFSIVHHTRNVGVAFALILVLLCSSCVAGYYSPPESLQEDDLVGVWRADYGIGEETLTLNDDGSFLQVYHETMPADVSFQKRGQWYIERFPRNLIRLWLIGGAYYKMGSEYAEPMAFYDPFLEQGVVVNHEFLLHVRQDRSGQLLLHHLFLSADGGFAIIGGETQIFRRVVDASKVQ